MARKRHTAARLTILSALFLLRALAQDRFLVRVDPAKIGEVAARHGMHVVRALEGSAQGLYVVETFRQRRGVSSRDELMGDARQMTSDPQVMGVEPDSLISLPELASTQTAAAANFRMPDKTPINYFHAAVWNGYVNQPAAGIVKNAQAHNVATGSGTVAVLDTGADFTHAGFGNSLVQGYDFVHNRSGGSELSDLDQSTTSILDQSTTSILDRNTILALNQSTTSILDSRTAIALGQKRLPAAFGRGTMVAGLIHLVAPNAKLMPVKVFGDDGSATLSRIVQGIYWAIDHNADVINMSFSSDVPSIELMLAINYANLRRVICVAAAGNDGKQTLVYPASTRYWASAQPITRTCAARFRIMGMPW
jgi:subtilisin family serine protease